MVRSDTADVTSRTPALQVGATLARSFSFYGRNLPFLAVLGAVVFLPLVLYQLHYVHRLMQAPMYESRATGAYILMGLYFLTPLVLQVFVSLAVFQHLAGERAQPLRSLTRGLAAFPRALGLAVLFGLILAVVLLALGLLLTLALREARFSVSLTVVVALVVALTLAWVHCGLVVAPQALGGERALPGTALGRGRGLARGGFRLLCRRGSLAGGYLLSLGNTIYSPETWRKKRGCKR